MWYKCDISVCCFPSRAKCSTCCILPWAWVVCCVRATLPYNTCVLCVRVTLPYNSCVLCACYTALQHMRATLPYNTCVLHCLTTHACYIASQHMLYACYTPWPVPTCPHSSYDLRTQKYRLKLYKGEACVVDKVSLVETGVKDREAQKVGITLRSQVTTTPRILDTS